MVRLSVQGEKISVAARAGNTACITKAVPVIVGACDLSPRHDFLQVGNPEES